MRWSSRWRAGVLAAWMVLTCLAVPGERSSPAAGAQPALAAPPEWFAPAGYATSGGWPGGQSAGQSNSQEPTTRTGYQWPLAATPQVTRRFDPPPRRWLPGHRGVDLAAAPGTVVLAAGAGTVFFAGTVARVGVVSIDHAGGLRTTYQPLQPTVTAGDRVTGGEPIGVLEPGHAGCAAAACLHWGLRHGELYLDPLWLLGLGRVRLLPLGP